MTDALHELTVVTAGEGLRSGVFSAVDLLESVLDRAHRTEAQLHAYLTIDREGAREAAAAADADLAAGNDLGPLHGIPIASRTTCVREV